MKDNVPYSVFVTLIRFGLLMVLVPSISLILWMSLVLVVELLFIPIPWILIVAFVLVYWKFPSTRRIRVAATTVLVKPIQLVEQLHTSGEITDGVYKKIISSFEEST